MNLFVYVKRLGQRHYAQNNSGKTLCDMPILGANYATYILEKDQHICAECEEAKKQLEEIKQ